jgi:hypothetical protein
MNREIYMAQAFSDFCIYTIVHGELLEKAARKGGSKTFSERKRWVTGYNLWLKAKKDGMKMAILLGDAVNCERLLYWGVLKRVQIVGEETRFTVERIRELEVEHSPQELVLRSTGKCIAPRFIRPYAICVMPAFLEA